MSGWTVRESDLGQILRELWAYLCETAAPVSLHEELGVVAG